MDTGWIKLYRKIFENDYYFSEPFTRLQAWIDLLLLANHKDKIFYKRGIKIEVKRGQVGYDLITLANRWQWSRGKVERFLNDIENNKQIVRQKNNVTTLISITNYNEYQADDKADSKADSKANGQQTVKQTDTNKNDNNVKNEKNDKKIYTDDFEIFWKNYPRRVGKGAAFKIWNKISKDDKEKIPPALSWQKNSEQWTKNNGQFIPHPSTYLNQRRWEDERTVIQPKASW